MKKQATYDGSCFNQYLHMSQPSITSMMHKLGWFVTAVLPSLPPEIFGIALLMHST
jgi:hypothetical protein